VSEIPLTGRATQVLPGRVGDRPGGRETGDAGSVSEMLARSAWFEAQRAELLAFLR
jgi:hypothetical protein